MRQRRAGEAPLRRHAREPPAEVAGEGRRRAGLEVTGPGRQPPFADPRQRHSRRRRSACRGDRDRQHDRVPCGPRGRDHARARLARGSPQLLRLGPVQGDAAGDHAGVLAQREDLLHRGGLHPRLRARAGGDPLAAGARVLPAARPRDRRE